MKWACEYSKWEIFGHPPYGPDLPPSDYHLLLPLKKILACHNLRSDQETKDVHNWMKCLTATFCDESIQ
jgi:hypothetical protein